jgi:hypothetical protein
VVNFFAILVYMGATLLHSIPTTKIKSILDIEGDYKYQCNPAISERGDYCLSFDDQIIRIIDFPIYSTFHPQITAIEYEKEVFVGDANGRVTCYNLYLEQEWKCRIQGQITCLKKGLVLIDGCDTNVVLAGTNQSMLYYISFGHILDQITLSHPVTCVTINSKMVYVSCNDSIYLVQDSFLTLHFRIDYLITKFIILNGIFYISGHFEGLYIYQNGELQEFPLQDWVLDMVYHQNRLVLTLKDQIVFYEK